MLLVVADIQTVVSFCQQVQSSDSKITVDVKYQSILKHLVLFVEDGSAVGKIGLFFQVFFKQLSFFLLSQASYDVMYLHVQSQQCDLKYSKLKRQVMK